MSRGFYRVDPSGELLFAAAGIETPTGSYVAENREDYTYPIDGAWRWFDSQGTALAFFALDLGGAVPKSVTARQARQALLDAGLLDAVEATVAVAPRAVQIAWEYGTTVERDSPFIAAMREQVGLTDEQVDALFVAAGEVSS